MKSLTTYLILLVLYYSRGTSIGTVNKTRFTSVDQLNSDALWLYNQQPSQQCLCTVLSQYNNVLLFNSSSNGSCQLFFSLPYTYTMNYNINSTIITTTKSSTLLFKSGMVNGPHKQFSFTNNQYF
jgi:hypothetical protein